MRWKAGKLFKIQLDNDAYAYALSLQEPEFAFFNCFTPNASPEEILESELLWRLWVTRQALKEPTWEFLHQCKSIPEKLQIEITRFKKDPISGKYSIYINESEISATKEQCVGLERAAVWSPEHVTHRLNDHLKGVENIWEVSLRP